MAAPARQQDHDLRLAYYSAVVAAQANTFAFPRRRPAERLGVAVVSELVELIVTGQIAEGELLPPEGPLSEHFGVSRTVIRESVKVIQEKGLVRIEHGRGTQVTEPRQWNLLDDVVLA
jgi:DNA-binding FadR family transcriptional regulator